MKRHFFTSILIVSALCLQAQERLSLQASREMALQHSDDMKIARLQIEKASAEQSAMKTNYLPRLSGSATGIYLHNNIEMEMYMPTAVPDPATGMLVPNVMRNPLTGDVIIGPDGNPVFNMYSWLPLEISLRGAYLAGISVEQPIYTGGKISAANAMTRIAVGMAMENLTLQRSNTIYETDQAYWLYVSVQEKVKLAHSFVELLDELEQQVKHAYETGYVTRNEWLKVAVKHNEARLQLQKAQSGMELTRMALCRQIGLPLDTPIETADSSLFDASNAELMTQTVDISKRPEYRLMQKNLDLAAEQYRLTRAEYMPTAGINAGYTYIGGIDLGNTSYDEGNANVIATVRIPLFHWGQGRKKMLSAKREQEIRQAERDKSSVLMTLEAEQSRLNLADAQKRVQMARQSLIQAEENLRVNTDNYELNMGVLTDLLEAQAHWQKAHSEVIDARAEVKLMETEYLKALGKL